MDQTALSKGGDWESGVGGCQGRVSYSIRDVPAGVGA